jgi:hypothetical protein
MHMSICDTLLKLYIIAAFLRELWQTQPQPKTEAWFTKYLAVAFEVR